MNWQQSVRVVMFCPQFRPIIGGAERQAEKLAATLVETGCRVTILTPRIDPNSPDREEANGVTIERFPLTDLSRCYAVPGVAVLNIPYIVWQVARAVWPRLQGADVLHCHLASLQTAGAALAGRIAHVPVLCKVATAGHHSDLGEIRKTGASGRLVAWLVRRFIQTWVATTAAVETALVRAGVEPRKIVRIPNGVELPDELNTGGRADRVRRLLYLGRLSKNTQRDIPTLVRAFDRIATKHPDLELAIVGGGDLFGETRRLGGNLRRKESHPYAGLRPTRKMARVGGLFRAAVAARRSVERIAGSDGGGPPLHRERHPTKPRGAG